MIVLGVSNESDLNADHGLVGWSSLMLDRGPAN